MCCAPLFAARPYNSMAATSIATRLIVILSFCPRSGISLLRETPYVYSGECCMFGGLLGEETTGRPEQRGLGLLRSADRLQHALCAPDVSWLVLLGRQAQRGEDERARLVHAVLPHVT